MVDKYLEGRTEGDVRTCGVLFLPILKALDDAGILQLKKRTNGAAHPPEGDDPNGQASHSARSSSGSTTSSRSSVAGTGEAPKKSGKKLSGAS
jgi:hypothetical protein